MEENKIITGFSTDDDFIAAVNEKGASIAKDSTPEALLDALNSIGGELTFESTNESVIDVVNAESSTIRDVQITTYSCTVGEYEPTAEIGSSYTLPTVTPLSYAKFIEWEDEEGNKLTSPITVPEGSGPLKLYACCSEKVVMNASDLAIFDVNHSRGGTFTSFADAVNGTESLPEYFGLPDSVLDKVVAIDSSGQSTAIDIGVGSTGLIGFNFAPGENIKVIQMEGSPFKTFGELTGSYTVTNDTTLRQALQYIANSNITYTDPGSSGGHLPLDYNGVSNVKLNVYYDDWSSYSKYFRYVVSPILYGDEG